MRPSRSSFALLLPLLGLAAGCNRSSGDKTPAAKASPDKEQAAVTVVVEQPKWTTLRRKVRQPGTIQSYERTPIFAKVAGYVRKWHVDIGDHVHKGQVLVELDIPELEVELKQRAALVEQAEAEVKFARAAVDVADAEQKRLKSQSDRLARVGRGGLLDQENIDESRYGYESAQAKWQQSKVDVSVKQEKLKVAGRNRDYTATLLRYATLKAPYDNGVVTQWNVPTGDFVQPATAVKGAPLYVIERRDRMRVLVDVPETDADWVRKGTEAHILVPKLEGRVFANRVVRTSYSLDPATRTLTAEIDLKNPDDRLRPGMFVTSTLTAESPEKMLSVSASAVRTERDVLQGEKSYCFLVVDGKARSVQVQIGARGDDRVQLLKKQVQPAGRSQTEFGNKGDSWEDFTGKEWIVRKDLAGLSDGQSVKVGPAKE